MNIIIYQLHFIITGLKKEAGDDMILMYVIDCFLSL